MGKPADIFIGMVYLFRYFWRDAESSVSGPPGVRMAYDWRRIRAIQCNDNVVVSAGDCVMGNSLFVLCIKEDEKFAESGVVRRERFL